MPATKRWRRFGRSAAYEAAVYAACPCRHCCYSCPYRQAQPTSGNSRGPWNSCNGPVARTLSGRRTSNRYSGDRVIAGLTLSVPCLLPDREHGGRHRARPARRSRFANGQRLLNTAATGAQTLILLVQPGGRRVVRPRLRPPGRGRLPEGLSRCMPCNSRAIGAGQRGKGLMPAPPQGQRSLGASRIGAYNLTMSPLAADRAVATFSCYRASVPCQPWRLSVSGLCPSRSRRIVRHKPR